MIERFDHGILRVLDQLSGFPHYMSDPSVVVQPRAERAILIRQLRGVKAQQPNDRSFLVEGGLANYAIGLTDRAWGTDNLPPVGAGVLRIPKSFHFQFYGRRFSVPDIGSVVSEGLLPGQNIDPGILYNFFERSRFVLDSPQTPDQVKETEGNLQRLAAFLQNHFPTQRPLGAS